jgi:chemotaxis protein CheD
VADTLTDMSTLSKWVVPAPRKTLVVGVADMVTSNDSSAELVTYSLGSCLGVTVYDPVRKVGGLLHLMLPDSTIDSVKAQTAPYMFVDTGVPRLFQTVYGLGGEKFRVVVRVAGGAQFLDQQRAFNIGERNIQAFSALLARNGHNVQGRDVGGVCSRTVRMDMSTGRVTIHSPGIQPYLL